MLVIREPILDVAQPRDANSHDGDMGPSFTKGIMALCPDEPKKYLNLAPAKWWTGPGEWKL